MAIAYLGWSIYYLHLISRFQFIASSWSATDDAVILVPGQPLVAWGVMLTLTSFSFVRGRECPGDWLDRVQDPQGVLGS